MISMCAKVYGVHLCLSICRIVFGEMLGHPKKWPDARRGRASATMRCAQLSDATKGAIFATLSHIDWHTYIVGWPTLA